jgi:hypothetical protein
VARVAAARRKRLPIDEAMAWLDLALVPFPQQKGKRHDDPFLAPNLGRGKKRGRREREAAMLSFVLEL